MELIEAEQLAEFENILRGHQLAREDFSLEETDTTDPKTDEVQALQGELIVSRVSTGKARQYLISDGTSWLDLFREDIKGGAFVGQDSLDVHYPSSSSHKARH